jgi:ribonuclease HI
MGVLPGGISNHGQLKGRY